MFAAESCVTAADRGTLLLLRRVHKAEYYVRVLHIEREQSSVLKYQRERDKY